MGRPTFPFHSECGSAQLTLRLFSPVLPGLLLLQLKRIGDAVLTAPALGALRQAMPEARITLVLAGAAGELAPLFAAADEVLVWQDGGLNFSLLARVRELQPETSLDFTGSDRSALISLISGAPLRAGYAKFADNVLRRFACTVTCQAPVRELHTIDFHQALAPAARLAVPMVPDAGHLTLPTGLDLPELPGEYVLVHPGTAREEKFWPPEHWAGLLDHLHAKHGLPVVLTGGDWDFERKHIARILSGTKVPVLDLRGSLNLRQWAGTIAGAKLAVTVDTAAMHMAAAFEVPQVALFGPTNPFHWAPRHPRAVVLHSGVMEGQPLMSKQAGAPMDQLAWETAAGAVDRLLNNAGCA